MSAEHKLDILQDRLVKEWLKRKRNYTFIKQIQSRIQEITNQLRRVK